MIYWRKQKGAGFRSRLPVALRLCLSIYKRRGEHKLTYFINRQGGQTTVLIGAALLEENVDITLHKIQEDNLPSDITAEQISGILQVIE